MPWQTEELEYIFMVNDSDIKSGFQAKKSGILNPKTGLSDIDNRVLGLTM
jgi:hypothetical protein